MHNLGDLELGAAAAEYRWRPCGSRSDLDNFLKINNVVPQVVAMKEEAKMHPRGNGRDGYIIEISDQLPVARQRWLIAKRAAWLWCLHRGNPDHDKLTAAAVLVAAEPLAEAIAVGFNVAGIAAYFEVEQACVTLRIGELTGRFASVDFGDRVVTRGKWGGKVSRFAITDGSGKGGSFAN